MADFEGDRQGGLRRQPVPGRVANTDAYGTGGTDIVPRGPGKTSSSAELPEGTNGPYESSPLALPNSLRADLEAATGSDLSDVKVHDDEKGHATAASHDANAVAIGSDIFMGAGQYAPSSRGGRELIAHEVAHVVQARIGGGVRKERSVDAAESEAQAFAGEFGAQGASMSWTPAVGVAPGAAMRSPAGSQPIGDKALFAFKSAFDAAKPDVAWMYLKRNENAFLKDIAVTLTQLVPPAHERLSWVQNGIATRFREALAGALGSDVLFIKLPELVYPADPWYTIDQNRTLTEGTPGVVVDGREPVGPMTYETLAGVSLGSDVYKALSASFARMVPRYLVQLDYQSPEPVEVEDLVTSHPMDRVTARLLCDEGVVKPIATSGKGKSKSNSKTKNKKSEDPSLFKYGVRFLNDWRWLGSVDPTLWNWVEVKDPKDATIEEVAASLWGDLNATQYAYGIRQSGPYFRIDPPWARRFADARQYEIRALDEKHKDNALDLAASTIATDAAIAQAADEKHTDRKGKVLPPDLKHLAETLERSHRQLDRAKNFFTEPKLWTLLLPAIHWVDKLRDWLYAVPDHRLQDLTPVIEGQSGVLFEASGAVTEISNMGAVGTMQDPSSPVFEVLREYAIVMGESHLIDSARAHLVVAREAKAAMPLKMLEMSARDTRVAVDELAEGRGGGGPTIDDAKQKIKTEQYRISALRANQAAGRPVDPALVANVAATLKEQAIEARANTLHDQLAALANAARDSKFGFFETVATVFDSNIRELPGKITEYMDELRGTVLDPHRMIKENELKAAGQDWQAQTTALNHAAGVTERSLESFIVRNELKKRMELALAIIEAQGKRTAVIRIVTQIIILIGASVAGGILGNMVAGAVRGALVADAATASVGMIRAANVAGAITGLSVDAGFNAGVQLAVQGGDWKEVFVSNFLGSAAVRVALTPLTKAAQTWGNASQELSNLSVWQKVGRGSKIVAKQGAILTTTMITGAATDYVVHRIYHSDKPPTEKQAIDWAIAGGSMAIGMLVGHWTNGFEQRAVSWAEGKAFLASRALDLRKFAKRVEKSGDQDAALELLAKRQELLQEEARVINEAANLGKLSPTLRTTMTEANLKERAQVRDQGFATVPLRLAGLTPDEGSSTYWTGTTEEIAIALHQAHRMELSVEVTSVNKATREWKVSLNGREIIIVEKPLAGRPRPAKDNPTDADRTQARRYADAADFMQERWEAKVKLDVDAKDVIEFDHLQAGYAYAGVVNQSTLPAQGQGLDNKVVVYKHKGTLSNRGEQELGQPPTKFDGPGVRATEQAPKDTPWIKSEQLDRALDIGRLENQTPAYRGEAIELQTPDKATIDDPWKAPNRKFRVKIRDDNKAERWFYADHIDNVGGLGPGSMKEVEKIVEPAELAAMTSGDQPMLLQGDDVDYINKLRQGTILIWGGSPTGAWAAEPVVSRGGDATVLGDTRPPSDWQKLFGEYNDVKETIAALGEHAPAEIKNRLAAIETMITEAHSGSKIPRNRKPGATYEKPLRGGRGAADVRIEFGSPSRITPTPDGRVAVTIGTGSDAQTKVYDQVVIAHGQDPARGPAAMLGKGADAERGADPTKREYGEVPAGTIALKPVWGPPRENGRREILGLESVDPAGIVLKGAAYASKRMSPWVKKSERAAFEHEVDAMTAESALTRDYGTISEDSRGVSPGMEVQRDRIPRANEVLNAKKLRLPGPDKTLELDTDQSKWDDQVREFFAINLRATDRWVKVKRLGGGATDAIVYHVSVDGTEVGIFKLFGPRGDAVNEQKTLDMFKAARLTKIKFVEGRGTMKLGANTGMSGAILMDAAEGTTVKDMLQSLPVTRQERTAAMRKLGQAVERVAEGLAEMHQKFGDNTGAKPKLMEESAKRSDADYFVQKAFKPGGRDVDRVRAALGDAFDEVKARAEGDMYSEFMSAEVPATAYHGDANAGNFSLSGNNMSKLEVFDVDKTQWSLPTGALDAAPANVVGTKTGAADVARFLSSLETLVPGALHPNEIQDLSKAFKDMYFARYRVGSSGKRVSRAEYAKAERWYQLEMELGIIRPGDADAKARVLRLAGLEGE